MSHISLGRLDPTRPPKPVFAQQLGLIASEIYRSTDFATTDTSFYWYPLAAVIGTQLRYGSLFARGQCALKHSAAPASVNIGMAIFFGEDSESGGWTIVAQDDIFVASSSIWTPASLAGLVDLEYYGITPGAHLLAMSIRNRSAGTLTVRGSGYQWLMDAFEIGSRPVRFISS